MLAGARLRYLAIALTLIIPGVRFAVVGVLDQSRLDLLVVGLVMIGFGGLWLIGRTGIPKSPHA